MTATSPRSHLLRPADFPQLQVLDLSGNELDFVPPEIGCLNLREIDVGDNKHIRVPELVSDYI